ncbi:MAG TPA: monofunctional biosynthetic peptidoglycan transglycosylase [Candidatus Competibacteraceae bacterium]|nr:monofunctional biosynthetic peptidoglycan transglycosylase [Candidatus Competibacteraceae bacterium]
MGRRLLRGLGWLAAGWVTLTVLLVLLLRWVPPLTSGIMVQTWFSALSSLPEGGIRYHWVPYEAISPQLALAVVAAEDQLFPAHSGFDWRAIGKALEHNSRSQRIRGASTISQQVAKNLFLWSGRSWLRKGLEAWFTLWLEALWSKQRILEVYLNIAEMGEFTFGAEAASRRYFGKPAAELSAAEAALLAAVLPNPRQFRVDAPSRYVRSRQSWILRQMRQLGGVGYLQDL